MQARVNESNEIGGQVIHSNNVVQLHKFLFYEGSILAEVEIWTALTTDYISNWNFLENGTF